MAAERVDLGTRGVICGDVINIQVVRGMAHCFVPRRKDVFFRRHVYVVNQASNDLC